MTFDCLLNTYFPLCVCVFRLFDQIKPKHEKYLPAFYFALRDTLFANGIDQAVAYVFFTKIQIISGEVDATLVRAIILFLNPVTVAVPKNLASVHCGQQINAEHTR